MLIKSINRKGLNAMKKNKTSRKRINASRERVKDILDSAGISQKWAAERIGITQQALNRCLKNGYLTEDYANALASLLGCKIDDFSEGADIVIDEKQLLKLRYNYAFTRDNMELISALELCWDNLNQHKDPKAPYNLGFVGDGLIHDLFCVYMWHLKNDINHAEREAIRFESGKPTLDYDSIMFSQIEELSPILQDYIDLLQSLYPFDENGNYLGAE